MAARTTFTIEKARRIGEEIGIDWTAAPFDVEQFRAGLDVELEHGTHESCMAKASAVVPSGNLSGYLLPRQRSPERTTLRGYAPPIVAVFSIVAVFCLGMVARCVWLVETAFAGDLPSGSPVTQGAGDDSNPEGRSIGTDSTAAVGQGRSNATAQVRVLKARRNRRYGATPGHASKPGRAEVTYGAGGEELPRSVRTGVRIRRSARAAAHKDHRTIVTAVKAPGLRGNDTLKLTAATQSSYCSGQDINAGGGGNNGATGDNGSPCQTLTPTGHMGAYHYPVFVKLLVYQARSKYAVRTDTHELASSAPFKCTLHIHHCPNTVTRTVSPFQSGGHYIHLELAAWAPRSANWKARHMLQLEGRCKPTGYRQCKYARGHWLRQWTIVTHTGAGR